MTVSRRASDMVPEEQRFLWRDRIPIGHITVIAGGPGKGKSTLGYRIAADADVPTLFITTEESDTTVWLPRIVAAGMDLEKAFHHPEIRFSKRSEDLAYLVELVDRHKIELVIVDPLSNHLRGASIHRDESVREVFEPYLEWLGSSGVALILQVHVLRSVNHKNHPLTAVPAGVVSIAKAVYLLGDHPDIGVDPGIKVLACADKFNFGEVPASMEFEYATKPVSVRSEITGRRRLRDYGHWIFRGETKVSAKMLMLALAPETRDRKWDRVGQELIALLRDGKLSVAVIYKHFQEEVQPSVSWRTVERVAEAMGIVKTDDPKDNRKKFWELSPDYIATLEEITEPEDEARFEEIDADVPDTVPEEWTDGSDGDDESQDEAA